MGTGCLTHRFSENAKSVAPSGQIKVLKHPNQYAVNKMCVYKQRDKIRGVLYRSYRGTKWSKDLI